MKLLLCTLVMVGALFVMSGVASAQCYHTTYYAPQVAYYAPQAAYYAPVPQVTYYAPPAVYYPPAYRTNYSYRPWWGGYRYYSYRPMAYYGW